VQGMTKSTKSSR